MPKRTRIMPGYRSHCDTADAWRACILKHLIHDLRFHVRDAFHTDLGHLCHGVGNNAGGGLLLAHTGFRRERRQHFTLARAKDHKQHREHDHR